MLKLGTYPPQKSSRATLTIHSTFNYFLNCFEPSLLLVSDTDHCLLKTWRRLECRLRKIEAYEDDTRLHFDAESDFPRFLDSVLERTGQISQTKEDEEIVEQHIVVVDQTAVRASYTQVYPETAVRILTPMTKKP